MFRLLYSHTACPKVFSQYVFTRKFIDNAISYLSSNVPLGIVQQVRLKVEY